MKRLLFSTLLLFTSISLFAQNAGQPLWTDDVAVSVAAGDQGVGSAGGPGLAVVSDGAGGAWMIWEDTSVGSIFAQHLDPSGAPLLAVGGIQVAPTGFFQMSPRAVSDGAGGVVIAWIDARPPATACNPGFLGDCLVAVQRLNAAGAPLFGATGVTVGKSNSAIAINAISSDGAGGATFAWESTAGNGQCCAFFAQLVDSTGAAKWGAQGLQISPDPSIVIGPNGVPPALISDGAGGAMIAYLFNQVNPLTQASFTAVQHVQANGTLAFPVIGIAVAGGDNSRFGRVAMITDGAGGAVMVLGQLDAARAAQHLILQRVDGTGASLWGATGKPLVSAANMQQDAQIITDGAGGWLAAWSDERNGALADCERLTGSCDVFVQRIDSNGNPLWTVNGVAATATPGNKRFPLLVPDGLNGAVIAWQDCRYFNDGNFSCDFDRDIFAQRLSGTGAQLWTADGVAVVSGGFNQGLDYGTQDVPSFAIDTDQNHGAILAWPDGRNAPCPLSVGLRECDVFAQRISDTAGPPPSVDLSVTASVSPNPGPIGAVQTYAVTVHNSSAQAAHGVSVKVNFPGLITASAAPAGCLPTDSGFVICSLGSVPPNSSVTGSFGMTSNNSGNFTNTAVVHATEIDPLAVNNTLTTNYSVAVDFAVSSSNPAQTVQAGQSATYSLLIRSQIQLLSTPPQLSCSGLPAGTACSFSPVTPVTGTLDSNTTLTISTTAPHTAALHLGTMPVFASLLPVFGFIVASFGSQRRRRIFVLGAGLVMLLFAVGCGGGGGGGTTQPPVSVPGTPAGTYTITVTAATTAFSHSAPLTLVVK